MALGCVLGIDIGGGMFTSRSSLMRLKTLVRRRGFTLIEVLVVVAIILTLGVLVLAGVGRITMAAHKAGSVSDLRQLSAISIAEAGENNGIFPKAHFGNAPFWLTWEFRDRNGITKDLAYGKSNECWTSEGEDRCENNVDIWNYGGAEEGSSTLFSYAYLIDDPLWTEGGEFLPPDAAGWERIREDVYNEEDDTYRWTPRRTGEKVVYDILWVDLAMIWNNRRIGNFHKQKEKEFQGVHVGYQDGHVEWHKGPEVRERFVKPGLTLYW